MLEQNFSLKAKTGLVPDTSKIEAREERLKKEYKRFLEYEKSKEPERFMELSNIVTSQDFRDKVKKIKRRRFKDTEAYEKYLAYKELKSSKDISGYLKFTSHPNFEDFIGLEGSDDIKKLEELENYVRSDKFNHLKNLKFKKSEEYRKAWEDSKPGETSGLKCGIEKARESFDNAKASALDKLHEYKTLKKKKEIKNYYKLKNSKNYEYFKNLHHSEKLAKFRELENYVHSNEFSDYKKQIQSSKKFKNSPQYRQILEYKELKKSKKLKWYLKLKKSSRFDELKNWELVFSDNFENESLNRDKWLTSYFWGKNLLNESYSLANDLHFFTENNNHAIQNGMLKLITRKETVEGKAWDPSVGFFRKNFDYTSGIVNTGQSFWQKHGIFEAKVRLNASPSVYHAFWMVSEKMVPHLNVFKFHGRKKREISAGGFWQDQSDNNKIKQNQTTIRGVDFSKDFYIFRLEWHPDEIIWKINNQIVKKERTDIFNLPMYIIFSSGMAEPAGENSLPVTFDIDWVKIYKPRAEYKQGRIKN